MANERNNGDHGSGNGDGGNGAFGPEPPTKVESGPSPEGDTIARARADALIFDRVASPLDALAASLGTLEDDLERLAPVRRLRALELMILKLRQAAECCFETAHDLTELHRAIEAQKDKTR